MTISCVQLLDKLSKQAGEVPIGAVIVHESEVIAKAWNQVEMLKDATAHAKFWLSHKPHLTWIVAPSRLHLV